METQEQTALDEALEPIAISIWRLGGLHWKELLKRVWDEVYAGNLLVHAAALAFYFLFAMFPLLIFMVNILGFFVARGPDLRASLIAFLRRLAPASAFALINATVDEIATAADVTKLVAGLIAALWFGSLGVAALSEALNAMYRVRESRSWLRVRISAIGLTVVLLFLALTALLIVVYARTAGSAIAEHFGQGGLFAFLWSMAQMPVSIVFMLLAFALVYYFAPDLKEQKWYWITPGSVAGVMLWLAASAALSTYLSYADSYSVTYGSLAGVIVLMLWFYVTGAAILIGGKVNAEIEHAAALAGFPDAKLHGEREPHQNG
jgi:membrane protein